MRRVVLPLVVLAVLVLGVVDAAGHSLVTPTVVVEVIGKGQSRVRPESIAETETRVLSRLLERRRRPS